MNMRYTIAAAAALSMMCAASAQAATVIGATSITVTNAGSTYLQVGEVVADDFNNVDVALASDGATATALNEYASINGAGKAIDGDLSTDYYSTNSIYHSAGSSADFLTVIFAAPTNLSSLTIYGRTDCCQERDLYNIVISGANGTLYSGELDATTSANGAATVNFASAVPEPSTWIMLLAGVAMIGGMLRLGRKRAVGLPATI